MAEIPNRAIYSQTDASNNGALPGLSGSSSPALIDNSVQAQMGATAREYDWRTYAGTVGGSANAYTLTYSVAPAAYYNPMRFTFIANFAVTGSATLNVNSLGAKTIKKLVAGAKTNLASGDINSGDYVDVVYDGTDFVWTNKSGTSVSSATTSAEGIVELATTTEVLTGTDTTRAVTSDALAALWEKGSDVASAGTLSLGEGDYFHVTGTTTITDIDFGTAKDGRKAILVFDGILTLTHNATTLVCPTGANITTAAGDTCLVVQDNSDNVKIAWYQRANGQALASSSSSAWTYLETLNPSSVADIANTVSFSGYNVIRITFYGVTPATNSVIFKSQISTDGSAFSDWDSGTQIHNTTGSATAAGASATSFNVSSGADTLNTASGGGMNGQITLYNYNQTEEACATYHLSYKNTSSQYSQISGQLRETGTTARTHIKFLFSSGNIASGRFVIEAMA